MPKFIAVIGSIILSGVFLLPLAGQTSERLTVEDGLSQGFVSSMLQTRNGFLWAATLDGLNRYDGVGFKTYHHDPLDPRSLNSNFVLYLYEDSQRRLWVVTDEGLNCMDQQTEKFYALPAEKQPRTKSGHSIRAFTEDCRGAFWGILNDSVYHFELPEHTEDFARQIDGIKISALHVPVKGSGVLQNIFTTDSAVWVGAENGIWTVSYKEGKVAPAPFPVPANMAGLWRDGATGDIWVYGRQSLHHRTGQRWEEFDLGDDEVTHIRTGLQGSQGVYFFSLHHVFLWKDGVLTKLAEQVPEEIMSACLDREGILWLGTNAGGIRKLVLGRFRFPTFLQGISTNFRICADTANRLWVYGPVGRSRRYYRFGEKNNRLEEPFLSSGNPVWLMQSRDGRYWYLDGQRMLCCVERPGGQPRRYLFAQDDKTPFAALFEDRKGDLVFFSDAYQLVRFDPASKTFTRYSFRHLYDSSDPVIVNA
ncbi:MAG: hypothetical protein KA165_19580, partial [Saprospiraceae bacterium]|nr:hypothetical protein [Saprospiraceae bacterium]